MDIELGQRGRASIDFLVSAAKASARLDPLVREDIAASGVSEETLAEDLDERLAQMEDALAASSAWKVKNLFSEWQSVSHGLIAREAFEEVRPALEPQMDALSEGPTTIETFPHFTAPDYMQDVWIHRTHGGWDGHEHQGLIHAEFVHRRYLTTVFGGNIFDQRGAVLDHLPRKDYRRIFEIGVSSGYHTLGLADAFPSAQISGCDFSRPMLEHAQRVANERQMSWKLYVGCGEETRLPAGSFDLVSSFIILHELPAPKITEVFAEAFRLLEPGGTMIMTDVPPYDQQDKLTTWRYDRAAVYGGEPYWREAGLVDTVAVAKEVGFAEARAFLLPGGGNYWVTIAEKA
jgi:SAM-dependent methyltransferase